MKTKILLLLALMPLTACRTRHKSLGITEYRTSYISRVRQDSVAEQKTETVAKTEVKKTEEKKEQSSEEEIEIHAKTDSLQKNFDFHNIVNGDTVQSVHITGNAEILVRSKRAENQRAQSTQESKEDLNIIAKVARTAVAQSTIAEAAGKVKKLEKDVKAKGFQWQVWVLVGMAVVIAAAAWLLSEKITGIINRKFK